MNNARVLLENHADLPVMLHEHYKFIRNKYVLIDLAICNIPDLLKDTL